MSKRNEPKEAGDSIMAENALWTFAGDVPAVFDTHVAKSVPFYKEGHDLILKLSDFFLSSESVCYDIGCSTGVLTEAIAQRNQKKRNIKIIGIDTEPDMVRYANKNRTVTEGLSFIEGNILEADLQPADLIISYYTMQFTKPRIRQMIFDKIYKSLNWGGAFILFEKVRAKDARFQDIATSLYMDYKIDQGYSSEQIITKTRSLKGVLEPFSTEGNYGLMERAGFKDIVSIMKYVCFEGFLAIK